MTNHLNQIQLRFQSACADFLVASYQAMEHAAIHWFGLRNAPEWESDEAFLDHLYGSPLAATLSLVSRAAAQSLDRENPELWEEVHDGLVSILGPLFNPPGSDTGAYFVPARYWDTEIGQMFALAQIWLNRGQLVTIAEAARIEGVALSTLASRVNRRQLASYPDPGAANPQRGARLVLRSDLTQKGQGSVAGSQPSKSEA